MTQRAGLDRPVILDPKNIRQLELFVEEDGSKVWKPVPKK